MSPSCGSCLWYCEGGKFYTDLIFIFMRFLRFIYTSLLLLSTHFTFAIGRGDIGFHDQTPE